MTPSVSVILCAHNPRCDYLGRALEALKPQTLPAAQWEFLLVDNASEKPLAGQWNLSWHTAARHIREDTPGLTPARLRGIRESRGELLVFMDDDNVLAPDYLEQALKLDAAFPQVAVWSGQIEPEFEQPPPEWTRIYWHLLALRTVMRRVWSNSYVSDTLPIGAGMTVRRTVAELYAKQVVNHKGRAGMGRRGKLLLAGEDSDIGYTALDLGFGCGIAGELRLTHLIPAARLQEDYLQNLARSVTYSHTLLALLRGLTQCSPEELFRQRLRSLWYLRVRDGHQRRYLRAVVAGRIAALKEFCRRQSS